MTNLNIGPKPAGEIDLVEEVRKSMRSYGLNDKIVTVFNNHPYIVDAENKPFSYQRFNLNRYWAHQLSLFPSESMDQRYCLVPNGKPEDWLNLFNSMVLPFVIDHNLPV